MERIEFQRDCDAITIPMGHTVTLEKGTEAFITQSLGGTFTLRVPKYGGLFRVNGKDADAIGQEVPTTPQERAKSTEEAPADLEQRVWEALKTCYDPEIPVNIVDLGLVYDMAISDEPGGDKRVDVKMTLTAAGCGMGASIASDARMKLLGLPGVADAAVDLVWEPPWTAHMMSAEARDRLGM